MNITHKQLALVSVVMKGNPTEAPGKLDPVDLDQLIERLDYKPTKASIQFSIRALVRRGLIEKGERIQRRGRLRAIFLVTELGRQVMTLNTNPSFAGTSAVPTLDLGEVREAQPAHSEDLGVDFLHSDDPSSHSEDLLNQQDDEIFDL